MRFVLMQLYGWSPTTFHSVWNADNCSLYVLRKSLFKPGLSPYVLDPALGDMPKSSIEVRVEFGSSPSRRTRTLTLHDYLSIPSPRTRQIDAILLRLQEQYPEEFSNDSDGSSDVGDSQDERSSRTSSFHSVSLMPFVVNHGGEEVWDLIDRAKQAYSRRAPADGIDAFASSHVSSSSVSAAASFASSSSHVFSHDSSPDGLERSIDDDIIVPLVNVGREGEGEDTGTRSLALEPTRRRRPMPQEFSCRIPEFDYWQLGNGRLASPSSSRPQPQEGCTPEPLPRPSDDVQ
jgi:hypothetical protein